ncbi:ATP12 family chaperone protein [Thalassospira profundimaris]|uniref:ATPase n=1 Tax=Thalassospira profundimaris TaxID=502049 RepID=A0A367WTG7_9PROT|nr:ATP12 family protein [Thalassospira profundimaris]RCK44688.1 ATPase [Thalassospira profundimaris]
MLTKTINRFYKKAEAAADDSGSGWRVHLDGRAVKSPAKAEFLLPSEILAREIAAEWDAQGEKVQPATMPIMQLAATAIDRVRPHRDAVIAELTGYGRSDLLCYRASFPKDLIERQARVWQPLLDWAKSDLDVALAVTEGVMPISQDDQSLLRLQDHVKSFDDYHLTALHSLTTVSGSVVIGLAVMKREIDAQHAFECAMLDEEYAIEQWGDDAEAVARCERHKSELLATGRYLELLSGN